MAITLEKLAVTFRDAAGRDVPVLNIDHLAVSKGEHVCLVGGSGSGKTTLLNVIAGIVVPTRGKVLFGDHDLVRMSEAERDGFRARNIGYVFQSFNLIQSLTAHENISLAGTFGGLGRGEARAKADQLLKRVDLSHRRDARPGTLSVGEQQRVGIARALINTPQVVLADEPTANLDEKRADEVLALLDEVVSEAKSTLVLVTHEARVRDRFDTVVPLQEISRLDGAEPSSGSLNATKQGAAAEVAK